MRRLLDAGRALLAELDPQAVLERTLAGAREITGARYAALAVLDEQRSEIAQFLTLGVDEQTRTTIGELPHGRGVLGVLITDLKPLRLNEVSEHPSSYGFPEGHPVMRRFLGVPIMIRGSAWGSLYLAEKQDGEFTETDEDATRILADWAATAIENARLYQHSEHRGAEQAPSGAEETVETTIAFGVETELARVLDLIVKRGRALIDARSDEERGTASTNDDEQLLRTFAASAATAVAMVHSAESDRVRSLMAAADAERSRWARELHDETLQGLAALRLSLAAVRRCGDTRQSEITVDEAIEHIDEEIDNLHSIISDLRPAALDELGLRPALEALFERRSDHELTITSELALPDTRASDNRPAPEIESTVYRVVQEALTNIVKHANARNVRVAVTTAAGLVSIEVQDDGVGFVPDNRGSGFGLAGMRERIHLAGGTVRIDSGKLGTLVRAELPTHVRGVAPSGFRQPSS
jgi:signal transduction histidine kinase